MKHTISALVENKFGVLARVAGMFSGRGFNIETLNVGPTHDPKLSRITATIVADEDALEQCIHQLERLVNVIEVTDFSRGSGFVARELVMVKIDCGEGVRSKLIEIAQVFRAKVIDVSTTSMIVECTGNENKVRAFLNMVTPFGITEMARTGNVALSRGEA